MPKQLEDETIANVKKRFWDPHLREMRSYEDILRQRIADYGHWDRFEKSSYWVPPEILDKYNR